jgi:porin
VTPSDQLAFLTGLYNGDPAGSGFTGLQEIKDPAGINFRLKDPPLLMAEVQYRYNQDKAATGLAGTIRLGGFYHFGKFNDQLFDIDGQPLAAASSTSRPLIGGIILFTASSIRCFGACRETI